MLDKHLRSTMAPSCNLQELQLKTQTEVQKANMTYKESVEILTLDFPRIAAKGICSYGAQQCNLVLLNPLYYILYYWYFFWLWSVCHHSFAPLEAQDKGRQLVCLTQQVPWSLNRNNSHWSVTSVSHPFTQAHPQTQVVIILWLVDINMYSQYGICT